MSATTLYENGGHGFHGSSILRLHGICILRQRAGDTRAHKGVINEKTRNVDCFRGALHGVDRL
jgi:hypothetical protein